MVATLTIIAIIIGPILAIQIQKYLEKEREEKDRRLRIFKTLMVTRGSILSPAHVEALNSIDIEFNTENDKDRKVREAWKAYLDHLGHFPSENPTEDDKKRWKEKTDELLVELLYLMAKAVGYNFDKTYIKRTAYSPVRYADIGFEQDFIRRSLIQVFLGNKSLPIEIRATSGSDGKLSSEERLRQLLIEHYEGEKPIKVIITDQDE